MAEGDEEDGPRADKWTVVVLKDTADDASMEGIRGSYYYELELAHDVHVSWQNLPPSNLCDARVARTRIPVVDTCWDDP